MLERRLQILIDAQRYDRVAALAQERGVSVATVVREAIDRGLPQSDGLRQAAGSRLLSSPPIPVPPPQELAAELEEIRSRRGA